MDDILRIFWLFFERNFERLADWTAAHALFLLDLVLGPIFDRIFPGQSADNEGLTEEEFRRFVRLRVASEIHDGLTVYETWQREISEIDSFAVRLSLRRQIRRFRPDEAAFRRARSRFGKPRFATPPQP